MASKFDPVRAKEAQEFVEEVTGEKMKGEFVDWLESGVVLCTLLNKLQPKTVAKINNSAMPFKKMENIAAYIEGSRKLGVPDEYNFVTVDLFEGKNLGQVVQNIIALKRARGHGFNKVDPKMNSPTLKLDKDDQTTDAKSQKNFVSNSPTVVKNENELSRTGQGKVSGRATNTSAMECRACTKPITTGIVNALGKNYHTQCFNCKKCDIKLSTAKYYEHDDQPYCERCILIVKPQTSVKGTTKDVKGFNFNK